MVKVNYEKIEQFRWAGTEKIVNLLNEYFFFHLKI